MEAALPIDADDGLFFADLSKQISLLIMDDDDEQSLAHCPSVNLQAFNQTIYPTTQTIYFDYDRHMCKSESKGTGVFIPRSPHQKRRNKQGKFRASGNRAERPTHNNDSKGLTHMNYNNNNNNISSPYQSVNHRTY